MNVKTLNFIVDKKNDEPLQHSHTDFAHCRFFSNNKVCLNKSIGQESNYYKVA